MTLAAALARLPAPAHDLEGQVLPALPPGAVTLAHLASCSSALSALVAAKRGQAKGGDDKLGCAYLIGEIGWMLGRLLGGLWLAGWHVQDAAPSAIALTLRPVAWEDDGTSGMAQVIDLHLDPAGLTCGGDNPRHLARAMVGLHQDLIAALVRCTGLGQAAQWRLVGDGLSGALLEQGKSLGQVPQALTLGRTILGDKTTKLHARQAAYVEIILPGETEAAPPRARDWFRLRGGCCRYYTSDDGEYCATCVLRDRDDQIARLVAQVAEASARIGPPSIAVQTDPLPASGLAPLGAAKIGA